MRAGGGKQKGSAFEREVCKALSLWVTSGDRQDVFWRSAMSGGRATVALRRIRDGEPLVRQAGDIVAVEVEGIDFCRKWYPECKHVKYLHLDSFFIKRTGPLQKFWTKAVKEALRYKRDPIIIARQNGWPTLVISKHNHVAHWVQPLLTGRGVDVTLFSDLLESSYESANHR